jgi:hypothetical protein
MPKPSHRRWLLADAAVVSAVAVVVVLLAVLGPAPDPSSGRLELSVRTTAGRAVPAGFLGLSLEYPAIERYAGHDPAAINPVFLRLVRNIAGRSPVLRIGGDSSDWTWWPVSQMRRPPGVTFTLTPEWLAVTSRLRQALGARLLLGINLEADSAVLARAEATALIGAVGQGSVLALEPGNEPELYGAFPWYRTASGQPVKGRPNTYDFAAYMSDFTRFAAALPPLPLAGPAVSGPRWMRELGRFIEQAPRAKVLTLHRYPLQLCFAARGSAQYPSVPHLLSNASSAGLAGTFAPYAAIAHQGGRVLRLDELNTVSCGAAPAVSQTFASALWGLDAMFEMVRAGVDGVNIHTFPGAGYELFRFTRTGALWSGWVAPEYYGLLMFAQAAPEGARLLPLAGAPSDGALKLWATRAPDGRIRVVAINKGTQRTRVLALRIPGAPGTASLERLRAPSVRARAGVTLGGWSFGARTTTGVPAPTSETLSQTRGKFVVAVPPGSAAMLTAGQ